MFSKIKYVIYAVVGIAVVFALINDKNGSTGGGTTRADLDQVLNVASGTLDSFENREDVNKENVMDKFAGSYMQNLNSSQPALNNGAIGVESKADGSFSAYNDSNNNMTKDEGEKDLFKLEIDSENNRLVASDETAVRDSHFSGTGLLMGMLIGSMLGRQRASGTNPAKKKATPKSTYKSARSRAGSGSHSKGK